MFFFHFCFLSAFVYKEQIRSTRQSKRTVSDLRRVLCCQLETELDCAYCIAFAIAVALD